MTERELNNAIREALCNWAHAKQHAAAKVIELHEAHLLQLVKMLNQGNRGDT